MWFPTYKASAACRTVYDPKGLINYLTKADNGRPIDGRLWGMASELKCLKPYKLTQTEEVAFTMGEASDMKLAFSTNYYAIFRPSARLRTKILRHYAQLLFVEPTPLTEERTPQQNWGDYRGVAMAQQQKYHHQKPPEEY
jgi:hypothetical protein